MWKKIPSFLNDESNTDKYETLVDFWISWTLRCANIIDLDNNNKKVNEYARRMLSFCLSKKENSNFLDGKIIKHIKCWKYYSIDGGQIDLWFELTIDKKKYALIFENKVYSPIKEGQLEKYKMSIDEYFYNKKVEVIYIFFRASDDFIGNDLEYCEKNNFVPILYYELQKLMDPKELTNNDLFDEFWFRW